MSEIIFIYNGNQTKMNVKNSNKINELFNQFATKINIPYDSLSFIHKGKEINKDISLTDFQNQINSNTFSDIKIIVFEKNNFISIKYKLNQKNDLFFVFGYAFVEKNKNNCKILYDEEIIDLSEKINIKENEENFLELKLIGINNITDASFMFAQCCNLIELPDITKWDTKNVVNMCNMFQECSSLSSLPDISKWNMSNVKDMKYMFYGCLSLFYLPDISKWDTSNVTNMSYMFDQCESLSVLPDISKWNTSKVTSMSNMFFHCKSLTFIPDISNWDMSSVKDLKYMFFNCLSLSIIPDITKWKIDKTISIFLFGYCINMPLIPDKFNTQIES